MPARVPTSDDVLLHLSQLHEGLIPSTSRPSMAVAAAQHRSYLSPSTVELRCAPQADEQTSWLDLTGRHTCAACLTVGQPKFSPRQIQSVFVVAPCKSHATAIETSDDVGTEVVIVM